MKVTLPPDPWQKVKTYHDLPADEVISAVQKEIRRGHTDNAARLAYEMVQTSPEMEAKLWKRLMVISIEDVGMGNPNAPVIINAIYEMRHRFGEGAPDRPLFALHAVRFLCECEKDRSSDELVNWVKMTDQVPEIPEYAIDMHTKRGAEMGKDLKYFYEEGSKVAPEKADRNKIYRQRLMEMLDFN